MRRNAASNSDCRSSAPVNNRICVRSAWSGGANRRRPRPSSTIAVGPSGISATNAVPAAISMVTSVPVSDEVADVELARGVQREPVESRDVRDRLDTFDAPVVGIGLACRRTEVDAPRGQLRFDPSLDEDLDQQLLPVALERQPIAFLDDDTRRILACRRGEVVHGGCVGIPDRQRQERRAITAGERLFEARHQLLDCVGRRRRLTAGGVRNREARERQEKAKRHGWSHIRPLGGDWGVQG